MKNKNLKILGIIFLILISLVAWQIYSPQITPESSPYFNSIKGVNKQNVMSINISKDKKTLTLQKKQNAWQINSKKAATEKVNELLSLLFPASSPDLISRTGNKFTQYQLTENLAVKISLDKKKTILLGKTDYPNIYARFDGQKDVFLLKNPPTLSTDPDDWYELDKPSPSPED